MKKELVLWLFSAPFLFYVTVVLMENYTSIFQLFLSATAILIIAFSWAINTPRKTKSSSKRR